MASRIITFLLTLFCFFSAIQASPFQLAQRTVFDPKIISPNSKTVWIIGTEVTVKWATNDAPPVISNGASVVLNGYSLDPDHALAKGFDLRAGSVSFDVPNDVKPGRYNITLFGDSGNISENFDIRKA